MVYLRFLSTSAAIATATMMITAAADMTYMSVDSPACGSGAGEGEAVAIGVGVGVATGVGVGVAIGVAAGVAAAGPTETAVEAAELP